MKMFDKKFIFSRIAKKYIIPLIRIKKYRKSMLPRLNELLSIEELILMLIYKRSTKSRAVTKSTCFTV